MSEYRSFAVSVRVSGPNMLAAMELNQTLGDWHRGHLLLHRQLVDSAIEQ
jgi:hypothetical protein